MNKLVTIGVPVYKRLEYLPNVLRIIASQDYPNIELLVSDNGMNGAAVPAIVDKHYPKPYRFRQNPSTVSCSKHFNQLIENASGEYFIVLADDDEISPNYVSELIRTSEKHPEASAVLAREETVDKDGNVIRKSKDTVPEILPGKEFIRAIWGTHQYGFTSLYTFLGQTQKLREYGGFPDIWAATSDEDLLMAKLSLNSFIAFNTRCTFRKRFYEASGGLAIDLSDLARGIREFVACLDSDPKILEFAAAQPAEWKTLRQCLVDNGWKTYYFRWADMYRKRLSPLQWVRAAFAMPFPYFRAATATITRAGISVLLRPAKRLFPQVYATCKDLKERVF
jgi:glycosyltransferase involved in cell wall biosynthesis